MTQEQDRALDAIQFALQMEIDGKEFYLKSSRETGNEMGKKLLASLAAEEDIHRRVFARIYEAIRDKKGWPKTDIRPEGQPLVTVFAEAIAKAGTTTRATASEMDAVQTARQMEGRTYDYYRGQLGRAATPAEKEFYESLSAQEQQHGLILADYYEYLRDPAAWFVKKEHPHLD